MARHPEVEQRAAVVIMVPCYTDAMLIAQQRRFILRPRLSLLPWRRGHIVLAVFALALLLAPLLRSEELTHNEQHVAPAGYQAIGAVVFPEAMPADGSAPAAAPHSHCAIHCSLASLVILLVLIGAPLLATRLGWFFSLRLQTIAIPPLSPPPQQTR